MSPPRNTWVGLTGGMGCGKTEVLRLFRHAGAAAVETDAIVRDLLASDPQVAAEVVARFGHSVAGRCGGIDRSALGALVFQEEAALGDLEAILHPRVRARWRADLEASEARLKVVEIPLLFEKNLEILFDFSVCVSASRSVQIARLRDRGLSDTQMAARLSRQFPLTEKESRADVIVFNNGSLVFADRQVRLLVERWT